MKTGFILKAAALACAALTLPVSPMTASAESTLDSDAYSFKSFTINCSADGAIDSETSEHTVEISEDGTVMVDGELVTGDEVDLDGILNGAISFMELDGNGVFTVDDIAESEEFTLTAEETAELKTLDEQLNAIWESLPEWEEDNDAAFQEAYAARKDEIDSISEQINALIEKAGGFEQIPCTVTGEGTEESPYELTVEGDAADCYGYSYTLTIDEDGNASGTCSRCYFIPDTQTEEE